MSQNRISLFQSISSRPLSQGWKLSSAYAQSGPECQHPTVSKQQRKPDPWLYELQSSPLPDMMGLALLLYLCVRWVHVCMCAMARVWKSQEQLL